MENEVVITYETLFEILRREKSREELQELPKNFDDEIRKYLEEKKQSLFSDSDDKFSELEQEKTRKQILNIKKLLNDLYERREKKIVNMALGKSRIPKSVINTANLSEKEKKLYDDLISVLNKARQDALNGITFDSSSPSPEEAPEYTSSGSKDAGAGLPDAGADEQKEKQEQEEVSGDGEETTPQEGEKASFKKTEGDTREVRFKCEVPQFVGSNLEIYGPFKTEETAVLPVPVCNVLVNKEKAEFLDKEE